MRDCTKLENYPDIVESLRHCAGDKNCQACEYDTSLNCMKHLKLDAAAAIEGLQAEVKRLKDANDELREAQTYIDHYGDKWMTSAKDVPTSAYNHGYADGRDEAEQAQLPKRGEWIARTDVAPFKPDGEITSWTYRCSKCGKLERLKQNYCPNCGAKMEVQDG